MMKLSKLAEDWAAANIIDQAAAERILQYENDRQSDAWVMRGLLGLGVVVIATGIFSIVAANWRDISDFAKLTAYFLTLGTIGVLALFRLNQPGAVREALLLLISLLILAGEALIGQIYHIDSSSSQILLLWACLSLPIVLLAETSMLYHLWFGGLTSTMLFWNLESFNLSIVAFHDRMIWTLVVPFISIGLGYGAGHILPGRISELARIWGFGWLFFGWTFASSLLWYGDDYSKFDYSILRALILAVGVFAAVFGILARNIELGKQQTEILLFTILTAAVLTITPRCIPVGQNKIIACLLFICCWSGAATHAVMNGRKLLFDIAASVVGLRFIVVYFEIFGSLASTGAGLVLSGLVILSVAYFWHNCRHQFASRMIEA